MTFFIIEHPTRGTFREWDSYEDKPRFSWSGARNDPEKAQQFLTLEKAIEMHDRIIAKATRSNKLNLVQIRKPPDYNYYCRECGGWIHVGMGGWTSGHMQECPYLSD